MDKITFRIDSKLKLMFNVICASKKLDMTEVLTAFIREYIQKNADYVEHLQENEKENENE
jgi:antitoxin component of RelBE/YafQ-DinJ toxin-antitoxin module